MRCLAIVHERDTGPGVFAEAMQARGVELDQWFIAESLQPPADPFGYEAVFSFGGEMNPDQDDKHEWMAPERRLLGELLDRGVPLMGSCLGTQLLGQAAGVPARRSSRQEIGWYEVEVTPDGRDDPVVGPMGPTFNAFQCHTYEVPAPPGAVELATSPVCLQAWRIGELVYGIQFHAEVTESDAQAWIRGYGPGSNAVLGGLDTARVTQEIDEMIGAWNQLGRELCGRFLDVVQLRAPSPAL